jgi:hypothetical protein
VSRQIPLSNSRRIIGPVRVAGIIFILASFAEIANGRNYLALERRNPAIIPSLVFSGALE